MMIIKIAGLSDGSHSYEFEESVEKLELSKPFSDTVSVDVELHKSHSQIVLKADIHLTALFECDRCTKDIKKELKTSYQLVYIFGNKPADSDNMSVAYLPHEADKIDIAPEVRDYALLSVPMKKLCSDDCKGLCPRCGTDLNVSVCQCSEDELNSKWQPLLELKKKLNNN